MVQSTMDAVVAVSIAILATIFVASLVALIIICRQKYCKTTDLISKHYQENALDNTLVDAMEGPSENPTTGGMELDDVRINASLESILQNNEAWVQDATGLVPHCLEILRTCHNLTEKLVGLAMGNSHQLRSHEKITDLVTVAKRISPRVDEVVRSMYPPLDPRLLEARCTALVLSVNHLVLVTKSACRLTGVLDWVEQSLADVEDNLKILREASRNFEAGGNSESPQQTNSMGQVPTGNAPEILMNCPLPSQSSKV